MVDPKVEELLRAFIIGEPHAGVGGFELKLSLEYAARGRRTVDAIWDKDGSIAVTPTVRDHRPQRDALLRLSDMLGVTLMLGVSNRIPPMTVAATRARLLLEREAEGVRDGT